MSSLSIIIFAILISFFVQTMCCPEINEKGVVCPFLTSFPNSAIGGSKVSIFLIILSPVL